MPDRLIEENGQYALDCHNALWATDQIHHTYQQARVRLNDVDFVLETEDLLILVEYKNASIEGAAAPEAFKPQDDKRVDLIWRKYFDSLHYLALKGKTKPKHFGISQGRCNSTETTACADQKGFTFFLAHGDGRGAGDDFSVLSPLDPGVERARTLWEISSCPRCYIGKVPVVMDIHIRQETTTDHEAVYSLVKRAFACAEHADGNEQDLVEALRKGVAFIPELSLVAEVDGKIAGHIMFTAATVDGKTVLALAPLSVLPEYQRKGIGKALIQEGHAIARKLGYTHSFVLGSETYYPKTGYVPAEKCGIKAPFDVPSENFMVCMIDETGDELHGIIKYAPEFGIE